MHNTQNIVKHWVLVKQRISKGDLISETDVRIYDSEKEAREDLEIERGIAARSFRYPDWDDFALREEYVPSLEPNGIDE